MGKVNKDPTVFGSTNFSLIIVKDANLDWVITLVYANRDFIHCCHVFISRKKKKTRENSEKSMRRQLTIFLVKSALLDLTGLASSIL